MSRLEHLWDHRWGLIVAPAGAGKTTLLAQFSAGLDAPVAWYRAESSEADPPDLLRHLERSCQLALGDLPKGWRSVSDAVSALEAWPQPRALLVVDDLQALAGTAAESALEELIKSLPPGIHALAASRTQPAFNLPWHRVSGSLLEISADDLRFRSWEVEHLFRDFYEKPLAPEDLAFLTRRTEGWAAGLQLFHLATRDRSAQDRLAILSRLGTGAGLVREYLTRNVLEGLRSELREFLIETCVLGRLSASLCDQLLGREGSQGLLDELVRRQIFTHAFAEDASYRYHEVLRSHLEALLAERHGEPETRARYRRGAELLEGVGQPSEALVAYCRAEDWDSVSRLLGQQGDSIAAGSVGWIDRLPPAILAQDPWVLLAAGRRYRAAGQWREAVDAYREAERSFGRAPAGETSRRERLALMAWLEPDVQPAARAWAGFREAVRRNPLQASAEARGLPDRHRRLLDGLGSLMAGRADQARPSLTATLEDGAASATLAAGARLADAVAGLLAGDETAVEQAEAAADHAERSGVPWLARLGRAALALSDLPGGSSEAAGMRIASERLRDGWGMALAALLEGLGSIRTGGAPISLLERAADGFRSLGAGTLEAWSRAAESLARARAGDPAAADAARQAELLARASGVLGPRLYCFLALAVTEPDREADHRAVAAAIAAECGLALPLERPAEEAGEQAGEADAAPSISIRCFGGFRLMIHGRLVDLGGLRPMLRTLLHCLALHAGLPVHREVLAGVLWPEADQETASRNLHVAISSLRKALETSVSGDGASLIAREGDAYRLVMPPDALIDVAEFDRRLAEARRRLDAGDVSDALAAFGRAIEIGQEELLPGEGPADWVVAERDRRRFELTDVARRLAKALLTEAQPAKAAWVCRRGLYVDRYRDTLWRMLIEASRRAGEHAAAARAEREYEAVLGELGLSAPPDLTRFP